MIEEIYIFYTFIVMYIVGTIVLYTIVWYIFLHVLLGKVLNSDCDEC